MPTKHIMHPPIGKEKSMMDAIHLPEWQVLGSHISEVYVYEYVTNT